jgi:hypothetical protein
MKKDEEGIVLNQQQKKRVIFNFLIRLMTVDKEIFDWYEYLLKTIPFGSWLFDFMNEIQLIENHWENIRESISCLFDLLKTFGLNSRTLTSNNATLPVLYYIYHKNIYKDIATSVSHKENRDLIRVWVLKTLLLRTFGQSADGVLNNARKAFTIDLNKNHLNADIDKFPSSEISQEIKQNLDISDEYIDEILLTQKDDRYAFAILSILYPNLDYKNNNFHLDHLHPASAYNNNADHEWQIHNSILNLQMLDANENESKNAMPLLDWVNNEVQSGKAKNAFLNEHLIPDVDLSYANFNSFIEERRKILRDKLRQILK